MFFLIISCEEWKTNNKPLDVLFQMSLVLCAGLCGQHVGLAGQWGVSLTPVLHPSTDPCVVDNVFCSVLSGVGWSCGAAVPLGWCRAMSPVLGWGTGFGLVVPGSSTRCRSWKLLGSFIYPLLRLQSHLAFPIVPGETQPSAGAAGLGWELCGSWGCGVSVPGCSLWVPSDNGESWAQPHSG